MSDLLFSYSLVLVLILICLSYWILTLVLMLTVVLVLVPYRHYGSLNPIPPTPGQSLLQDLTAAQLMLIPILVH